MKKLIWLSIMIATVTLADFKWAESYEAGLQQGKKEQKLILLMFSSPTCHVCDYMKTVVHNDEQVKEYVENFFVPIKVEITEYPKKKGYEVYGTPTYYFLDSESKQIGRIIVGGAKPDEFYKKLQEIVQGDR